MALARAVGTVVESSPCCQIERTVLSTEPSDAAEPFDKWRSSSYMLCGEGELSLALAKGQDFSSDGGRAVRWRLRLCCTTKPSMAFVCSLFYVVFTREYRMLMS